MLAVMLLKKETKKRAEHTHKSNTANKRCKAKINWVWERLETEKPDFGCSTLGAA